MSATLNVHDGNAPKRVLMVVANAAVSPVTGWPVGFWWAELTHPYWVFKEHGYEVEIVSPQGGTLVPDSWSDPEDASGYSAHDLISLGFKHSPTHRAMVEHTRAISEVSVNDYDAIFLVGGQSPMVTFAQDAALHAFVADAWEAGKVLAIVCHATAVLLHAKLSDGTYLVEGKTWTGFADSEEDFADAFVGQRLQPFRIEEEARKMANTNFVVHGRFKPHALRDGRLITGQQQYSGEPAARLVVEALGV